MNKIQVKSSKQNYSIIVGPKLMARTGRLVQGLFRPNANFAIVTQKKIAQHYLASVKRSLRRQGYQVSEILLPDGEKAKSEKEREVLHGYVRTAFSDRYDKLIADRKKDLEKLKQSVARLDSDLKRREAAKDRVVQLQLQSVQLAAEGLLELGELRGVSAGGVGGLGGAGYSDYGGGGKAADEFGRRR